MNSLLDLAFLGEQGWKPYIVPLVSIAFFLLGLGLFIKTKWIKAKYRKAKGVVVDYEEEWGRNSKYYYPVFEFTDHRNNSTTVTSSIGLNFKSYTEGLPINVYYHPDNPEKAEIDSTVNFYLFPILFMIAGFVVALLSILPMVFGQE